MGSTNKRSNEASPRMCGIAAQSVLVSHQPNGHFPLDLLRGAAPYSDQCSHLQYAVPGLQVLPDGVFDLGGMTERLALLADTIGAGEHSLVDDLPLLLTEH